jgi:hypothetical protein
LKGKIVFPYWMQFFDYLKVIAQPPLALSERIRCYLYMFRWFLEHLKKLLGDIILALYAIFRNHQNPYSWRNQNKDIYNWE